MVGEKCVDKHTAKSANAKNSSATIAIHISADEERQMPLQKVQPDEMTQFRVTSHYLANRSVLIRGNIRTYTWSHPDRIPQSAKSKRSNTGRMTHRMDLLRGRNGKEVAFDMCTRTFF